MTKTFNVSEAAIEILTKTSDGDDLIPVHLKLVEHAVNGFLNEKGITALKVLLDTVRSGYAETRAKQIAELNDQLRITFNHAYGQILYTQGIQTLGKIEQINVFNLVKAFNAFTVDNDPYGEHDFGAVQNNGKKVFWKIDYYGQDMMHRSEDPADSECTNRVLTIMLANEY